MSDQPLSRRAWIRALLITLAIGVHGIYAAPVPHIVTKEQLKNPVSRDEVATWADRLTAIGYTIDTDTLGQRVVEVSGQIGGLHRSLKLPFIPWMRLTGTGQGWALFANPDTHPGRLSIRIRREGGAMEDLYLQLDPEHDWWRSRLAYRRLRGCWSAGGFSKRPRSIYRRFSQWIADRIFAVAPDVVEVQVRTLRTHTTLPGEPPDDRVEKRHVITIQRDSSRAVGVKP